MAYEIFKLQRALSSTEKDPPVLAYNQDRSKHYHVRLDAKTIKKVFRGSYKVFRHCKEVDDTLEIIFDEVLPDRGW